MKHKLRINRVYFSNNKDDDGECESENETHQEYADECVQCEDNSETEDGVANFDILEENCHWIKPRQEDEADSSFGGSYYHHRLYHKYTYLDITEHLTNCRLPQPSINKKLIKK
ncbi:hypothetical protein CBL_10497 [Carabus blaptoides fortunei]